MLYNRPCNTPPECKKGAKMAAPEYNPAIIMTTRVPIDGSCKTRLSGMLAPGERQQLQRAMIQDELQAIREADARGFIFFTPASAKAEMEEIAGPGFTLLPQTGDGLGQMMVNAFSEVFAMGYSPCVLVGSDVPTLSTGDIQDAIEALEGHDVVMAPTEDGGYCLIGMTELHREAFDVTGYGGSTVLEKTVAAIESAGKSVRLITQKQDIDTPDDLAAFMAKAPDGRCPRTYEAASRLMGRSPRISIVIPAYNEEKTLPKLLPQLEPLRDGCQIVFVDGGSRDATRQLIEDAGYPCLSGSGRGNQLNVGARHATGDALFFLHCDSVLPADPLGQIREILQSHDAGFFGVRFDCDDWVMGVCGRQSNRRARYRQIPFGDQGIFIKRALFWELGGFPEIPIMEDYEFSMKARSQGVRFGQAREPIVTSARRFGKGFFHQLKVMYQMHELRYRYRHGCSPEELRERYRKVK